MEILVYIIMGMILGISFTSILIRIEEYRLTEKERKIKSNVSVFPKKPTIVLPPQKNVPPREETPSTYSSEFNKETRELMDKSINKDEKPY